jgi:flagellar protein FlaI
MRHRPDVLIVGEVRGQEAYVLFQALATGHGGMCTMHADSLGSAVKRLTQKPMDISSAYIPLMNVVLSIQRVYLKKGVEKKGYRRVLNVNEIADYEDYRRVFNWSPTKDEYSSTYGKSKMLQRIDERLGLGLDGLKDEIERRRKVLAWMRKRNVRSYKDVATIIAEYYARPDAIYAKVVAEGDAKKGAAARKA